MDVFALVFVFDEIRAQTESDARKQVAVHESKYKYRNKCDCKGGRKR